MNSVLFKYGENEISINTLINYLNVNNDLYTEVSASEPILLYLSLTFSIINNQDITLNDETNGSVKSSINNSIKIQTLANLQNSIIGSKSRIGIRTSGTEGDPKLLFQPVKNLIRSVKINPKYINTVWGTGYNPFHMAFIQIYFQALLNFNKLVLFYGEKMGTIEKLINDELITHLTGTPSFYRMLCGHGKFDNIKHVTMGGEKCDTNLLKNINISFPSASISNIYASTEAGSILNSCGDYFTIRKELKEYVKIQNNQILIHKKLLADNVSIKGQWFESGDIIELVDDDKFIIIGRSSEIVNIGGEKVFITEIENILLEIPEINDVRVYAKKNSVVGSVICADIKLKIPDSLTELELNSIIKTRLRNFQIPRLINFVNEITLTKTGKKKR